MWGRAEAVAYARQVGALRPGLDALMDGVRARGGRLFILGVGGSAGNASHAVNDFRKICGFEAYAPTDNVSELTARTNDDGRCDAPLLTDAAAAIFGSLAGTTTTTSYIESAAGVAAGGRTGLTAVVVGLLFLLALVFAPFAQIIPAAATAPALILVGALMMAPLAASDWEDPMVAIPGFLTLIAIPLTFSIANGLAFGITAYAVLKAATGKATRADWMLMVLGGLFVIRFAYLAAA